MIQPTYELRSWKSLKARAITDLLRNVRTLLKCFFHHDKEFRPEFLFFIATNNILLE